MASCPFCGTSNRASAVYCQQCGGALRAVPGGPAAAGPRPQHGTGRLPPRTLLAGHYLLLETVGQGGMAAVYKAMDTRTKRNVALKEMSQDGLTPQEVAEAMESFRIEADMLTRLRHPNLPRFYERFSEGARHYLAMDFVEGQTLEQRQAAAGGKPLPEREVMVWAGQLCSVLTYLHAQRPPIIFRDLKPANVMLTPAGQVQLIDFGIARVFSPGRLRDTQALGTPGFAPPEQYGKAQTDARADVYALGCTLYQLLSGYDPATTPFALPPLHLKNTAVSPHIGLAITRATQLDRDARFARIEDFQRALLAPDGYYFHTGACAHTLRELLELCRQQPREAAEHLALGRIEAWLRAWKEPAAADAAARAMRSTTDRAEALRTFLSTATAAPASARTTKGAYTTTRAAASAAAATATTAVLIQPQAVQFGRLVAGQRGTLAISISGEHHAHVRGQLRSLAPWLLLDRQQFDGVSTLVQLTAETSRITTPGTHTASLQITAGQQNIFVTVTVEVAPAAAPARPKSTAAPRAIPGKYAQLLPTPTRAQRFAAGFLLAASLSAVTLTVLQRLVLRALPPSWPELPVAIVLLCLGALAAVPGALAGTGLHGWRGRNATTLFGAGAGLLLALSAAGPWLAAHASAQLAPQLLLLLPLAAGMGAALGADQQYSRAMLAIGGFMNRRAALVVTLGATLLGGWLGFALAGGVFFGIFAPVGLVLGALLGASLARRTTRRLRRPVRVRP